MTTELESPDILRYKDERHPATMTNATFVIKLPGTCPGDGQGPRERCTNLGHDGIDPMYFLWQGNFA